MKNRTINLLVAAALVFSLLAAVMPVAADSGKNEISGTVSAVDVAGSTLTVTPQKAGADVILKVDSTTSIQRNNHPAALADIQVGDKVEAKYDPATMLASRVKVKLNLAALKGTISAVDTAGSTVSVTPKSGGAAVVLKVDSSTMIRRGGKAITLADLQVGNVLEAKYSPVSMLAVTIKVKAAVQPKASEVKGVISAVDTGGSTVSVTPKSGGADVALKVDSSTVIKRNDRVVALADLQVGDKVEAKYDPATLLAGKIEAEFNQAELKGKISAVDSVGGSVSVTPKSGGADVALKVDGNTVIRVNGKAASLADLQVGSQVEVQYDAVSMLATRIEAEH